MTRRCTHSRLDASHTHIVLSIRERERERLTTPLDVLRTRHVLRSAGGGGDPSFLATARHVLRAEGMCGLLRGVVPRTVYMSLGGVLYPYLGTYSTVCRVWS